MPRRLDYPDRLIRDVLIGINNGESVNIIAARMNYPSAHALGQALHMYGRDDLARRFRGQSYSYR